MSDIDERLEEEILHAFRKSFDSQQAGINLNFLMDIQREIERLRAENEKLRAALNRIDGMAVSIVMLIDAEHDISANSVLEIRKECRAAAAALKEKGDE